jgi:signal transduction histidine kinase
LRGVVAQIVAAGLVILALVAIAGSVAARRASEREAVNDALQITNLLATGVIGPALEDGLLTGDAAALRRFDDVVHERVLGPRVTRVKIWNPSGRILYSDEPRLIGDTFPLGADELQALAQRRAEGEVSELDKPENRFERSAGTLLETYRPVWTPGGQELLFETYTPYSEVTERAGQLARGFAGIIVTSLLGVVVLMMPLGWALAGRVRRAQEQREAALRRAVEASDDERRRIAATLHDGVVQELAATSYLVTGAADRVTAAGHPEIADPVRLAARTIRSNIAGLRSLLVDIYPPSLRTAGLAAAITDLASGLPARGVEPTLDLADPGELAAELEELVFRVAQETVRNVIKHAGARHVTIALSRDGDLVRLLISDDGIGLEPADLAEGPSGHFGLRLMTDLASVAGAELSVASAPGRGTAWLLEVPAR